jgi:hypothetical protein
MRVQVLPKTQDWADKLFFFGQIKQKATADLTVKTVLIGHYFV